jgi:hypothetical protein
MSRPVERPGSKRKPRRKIVTVASEQSHADTIATGHDAEAVVFDLVNPV